MPAASQDNDGGPSQSGGPMADPGPLDRHRPRAHRGVHALGRLGEGGQGASTSAVTRTVHVSRSRCCTPGSPSTDRVARTLVEAVRWPSPGLPVLHRAGARRRDADPPYVVSEYIDGPSLQRPSRARGPLRGPAGGLAVGTATALAAIHRRRDRPPRLQTGQRALGPRGPARHRLRHRPGPRKENAILTSRIAGPPPTWPRSRSPVGRSDRPSTCSPGVPPSSTRPTGAARSATAP